MVTKKNLQYYLNLNWSYTIEQEILLVKEAIEGAVKLYMKNGEEVPEPIKKEILHTEQRASDIINFQN